MSRKRQKKPSNIREHGYTGLVVILSCSILSAGCNLLAGGGGSSIDQGASVESTSSEGAGAENTPELPQDEKEESPQGAVAEVNGSLISRQLFDQLFEERARVYRLQKKALPPRLEKTYRASALQKLIDQTLLQQHFDQRGLTLTPAEREAAFTEYKDRFRGEVSFTRFIQRSGKTEEEVRSQVEFDALTDKAILQFNPGGEQVSEEEIRSYYEQYKESKFTEPAKVRAAHLLLRASANASKKQITQRKRDATRLLKTAKKGDAGAFLELIKNHSEDTQTRLRNGDLNYFERHGLPMISKAFEEAAAALKVGEISEPVLTDRGYHLIRLTDRQPPQVKVSHILLAPDTDEATVKALMEKALVEDFDALAKENSKDESSRLRGGELGFILSNRPHRFGDEFRDACIKSKLGEIVGPIRSSEGLHIIQVTARREERLRASHILIALPDRPNRAQKREALEKINKIKEELNANTQSAGNLFIRLAKRYSEHSTRDRGGDLGAFFLGGTPMISHSFEEAAFDAEVGKVIGPVQSPFGWHLIYVHDHKKTMEQTLDQAREEIIKVLSEKSIRSSKSQLIKKLRSEAQIKRFIEI